MDNYGIVSHNHTGAINQLLLYRLIRVVDRDITFTEPHEGLNQKQK